MSHRGIESSLFWCGWRGGCLRRRRRQRTLLSALSARPEAVGVAVGVGRLRGCAVVGAPSDVPDCPLKSTQRSTLISPRSTLSPASRRFSDPRGGTCGYLTASASWLFAGTGDGSRGSEREDYGFTSWVGMGGMGEGWEEEVGVDPPYPWCAAGSFIACWTSFHTGPGPPDETNLRSCCFKTAGGFAPCPTRRRACSRRMLGCGVAGLLIAAGWHTNSGGQLDFLTVPGPAADQQHQRVHQPAKRNLPN